MMNGMEVQHNPSLLTLEYDMELPAATFHGSFMRILRDLHAVYMIFKAFQCISWQFNDV